MLIAGRQRADDAEIDRGVLRLLGIVQQHEDVARMHVGVEEVVAERLREKDLHAVLRPGAECSHHDAAARPRH